DRKLWDWANPPADLDLEGYFQETPACWRQHRPLLRRMFRLAGGRHEAIDAWRRRVTDDGRRTLVAVHVRRGDYRRLQHQLPYFWLVPDAWYVEWLRSIWPTLRDPLLFVATDEPDAVGPAFREFESVSADFDAPAEALPDHVRDFEVLRRADHLALSNSSYPRMAAMLCRRCANGASCPTSPGSTRRSGNASPRTARRSRRIARHRVRWRRWSRAEPTRR
ncbi:MAG: hypothetical protein DYH14_15355, partial [Betaproteobacteria bacterium PRO3]|nr:hypothetical protein [Betaproteobacteria bacterium PRO3]